jgi:hypothetical protein
LIREVCAEFNWLMSDEYWALANIEMNLWFS